MWAKITVISVPKKYEPVIQGPIEDMVAHITPMAGGERSFHIGIGQRDLHLLDRHVHQTGIAVGPFTFVGHPIGAHIAFFKNVYSQASGLGFGHSLSMDRTRVTIKYDICDTFVGEQRDKGVFPFVGSTPERDIAA